MEILAPAGNPEALERAQAAGADAVYLGYAAFSARAGAGNFDDAQLAEAIAFAHLHRMRVYVTVNTLVKDAELPEALALLRKLAELRADGVLVQDLGILRLARREVPSLRIHASTQMAIHNASGVRWCRETGMKRVVLARECSLEEIRKCAAAGLEIEVFAHGAQCVSVSGECLFSAMVGERSGNRGRCAQPCRKRYRYRGREGAWLSPRDLCLRDRLPELADAGAASLKIEGRLKRPEYVYITSDSYRRALDSLEKGAFQPAGEAEAEALKQIFHRGGFMAGYAFGAEDAGVIYPETVNHQGIALGRAESVRQGLLRMRVRRDLHDGDGLRILHGDEEGDMTYAGKEVPAGETAVIRLRPGLRAEPGDPVFRLTDAARLAAAMAAERRRIPVDMTLEAWPGKPLRLILTDGDCAAEAEGEAVEAARSRETTEEEIRRQLGKTGGTDFEARNIRVRTAGAFVPVSSLNSLRRQGLEALAGERRSRFAYPPEQEEAHASAEPVRAGGAGMPAGNPVTVRTPEQAAACRGVGRWLIWYPEDFREEALDLLLQHMEPGDWIRLPEVCEEDTLQALFRWTERNADRLGGVMLGSVGQLGVLWPVPVAAGPGVPVMNRQAAALLRDQGCAFAMASPELTGEELRTLLEDPPLPLAVPVYGRTQLMLLHHCPARTALGLSRGHAACRMCDAGDPEALRGSALEDERGYRFPLERIRLPEGCLVRLLNSLPLDLGEKAVAAPWAAEMTEETGGEAAEILACLERHGQTGRPATRGHWSRAVL